MEPVRGNGFELDAGPAHMRATGSTVVQVLLAILVIGASFYGVFTTNQQTIAIQAEHAQHLAYLSQEHRALRDSLDDLARINENVFLASILTAEQKKDLPPYLKDRARDIVENRAKGITQTH